MPPRLQLQPREDLLVVDGHSLFAGAAVIASAVVLIVGLFVNSAGGRMWLSAVAVYYAVLFACSVAGLTPAPLIGYGAGPLLGFGLMAATASWLDARLWKDGGTPSLR